MTASPPVRAISPGGSTKQRSSEVQSAGNHGSQDSVSSSKDSLGPDGGDEVSKDAAWEHMFNKLKAIKAKTGTCNLPDKKGDMAKWVYAQRKAFRRLQFSRGTPSTRARVAKLESIGFEFSSSSYVSWDIMFEKYLKRDQVDQGDDEARKLKLWMSNQRLEYSRKRRNLPNNITEERIAKLEAAGFQWVGRTGKPTPSSSTSSMVRGGNSSQHPKEEESGAEGAGNEGDDDEMIKKKVPKRQRRREKSTSNEARLFQDHASVIAENSSAIGHNHTYIDRTNASVDRNDDGLDVPNARSHITKTNDPTPAFALPSVKRKHGATRDYYIESIKRRGRRIAFLEDDDSEEDGDHCYVIPSSKRGRKTIYRKVYFDANDDDEASQSDSEGSESSCSLCEKAALKARHRSRVSSKRMALDIRDHGDAATVPTTEEKVGAHHKSAVRSATGHDKKTQGLSAENTLMGRRHSNEMMASDLRSTASLASASTTNSSKNNNQGSIQWPATASLNSASRGRAFLSSVPCHGVPPAFIPTEFSTGPTLLPPGLSVNDANSLMQMPNTSISSAASDGGMFVTTYVPPHQAVSLHQQLSQHQSLVRPRHSSNDLYSNLPFGEAGGGGMHVELPHSVHSALGNRYPLLATLPRGALPQDPNFPNLSVPHFLHPR